MRNQTAEVYEAIKNKIVSGSLRPSESLTEQELAEHYGVSRSTIKKALLMLCKENLVAVERNKSAKVRDFSPEDVLEYLEVREVLEGLAIKKSIAAITSEQVARLETLYAHMQEHVAKGELFPYSEKNREFHSIIYDACTNKPVVEMIQTIKNQLNKYNTKTILIPERREQSIREHGAILDAVKARDAERAERLIREHIANVRATFRDNFLLLL